MSEDLTDVAFLEYIVNTLMPDLRESGFNATADDFDRLVEIITTEERWLEIKYAGLVRL